MYAIVETGGKQYRVSPGDRIRVELLPAEPGSEVVLHRVLAVSTGPGELRTGPDLGNARVRARVEAHGRGDKIIVFKFKRRKQYKRTIGHRQGYTELKIEEILV